MAVDWRKTQEKLDKLRRNETQMTPEQKIAWKKNLQAFRNQIIADANEILSSFLFGSMEVLKEDEAAIDQIIARIKKLAETDWWNGQMKNAKAVLFGTYSLDSFLDAICRMHTEVWYKAYGPYWVSKTITDPTTGEMTNPIVDAIWGEKFAWSAEHRQWEGKEKLTWTIMLPPTMELLKKSYEEEVQAYARGSGQQNAIRR